jgi:hypothetical protein
MRKLIPLALVALAAYASGHRQGTVDGQVTGYGLATKVFTAGWSAKGGA